MNFQQGTIMNSQMYQVIKIILLYINQTFRILNNKLITIIILMQCSIINFQCKINNIKLLCKIRVYFYIGNFKINFL